MKSKLQLTKPQKFDATKDRQMHNKKVEQASQKA
jgi:hypothetical protein